jgi:hypothetical protein
VLYRCPSSLSIDSLILTAEDTLGASISRTIVLIVNNQFPIIDSVRVGDAVFVARGRGDSRFEHTVAAAAEVSFELFAHDPDKDDITAPEWYYSFDTGPLIRKGTGFSWTAADSTYIDSVVVQVRDNASASDRKTIVLNVK